jgi:hypothetical protein
MVRHIFYLALLAMLVLYDSAAAQQPRQARPGSDGVHTDPELRRPIPMHHSVWIEDLTWMEVRDKIRAGMTTAIIPTGGIEQNGPFLTTDKHNVILQATGEAIAKKLGNALIVPIVAYVPEGPVDCGYIGKPAVAGFPEHHSHWRQWRQSTSDGRTRNRAL